MTLFAFLGTQEIMIVLVLALIVFGPQKLPEIGRQIGSAMRELRKITGDFQHHLDFDGLISPSPVSYDTSDWNGGTAQVIPQGTTIHEASTAGLLGSVESSYAVASEGRGAFVAPPGPAAAVSVPTFVSEATPQGV